MILWSGKQLIFKTIADAGFASGDRQNKFLDPISFLDEEVSDMFLFWVYPELEFSSDELGELRQEFVDGFEDKVFKSGSDSTTITSLGMKTWIERAANATSNQTSWLWPLLYAKYIVGEQCINMPPFHPTL